MTAEGRAWRWRRQEILGLYVAVIPLAVVLDRFVDMVLPGPFLGGPWQAAFIVDVFAMGLATVLFVAYRPVEPWRGSVTACLTTLLALWVLAVAMSTLRGSSLSATAFLVPLGVAMAALKRPSPWSLWVAADAFAWALALTSVAALALEVSGAVPSWYDVQAREEPGLAAGERNEYWLPLADLFGLAGRWAGPFGHPSLAGPVGAFLVVYALVRRGPTRMVLSVVGVLLLLLAGSRASMLSALVAALVWIGAEAGRRISRRGVWILGLAGVIVLASSIVALVGRNPGLSGRTSIWPEYASLWRESPLLGVGATRIWDAIESGALPMWASHGHNMWLDALTRTGLVGFSVLLALMVQAFLIALAAARSGEGAGLALLALVIFGTLADTVIDWRYAAPTSVVLLFAILLSGSKVSAAAPPESRSAAVPPEADVGSG